MYYAAGNSLGGSESSSLHVALDRLPPAGLQALGHHALHAVAAIRSPPTVPVAAGGRLLIPRHRATERQQAGCRPETPQKKFPREGEEEEEEEEVEREDNNRQRRKTPKSVRGTDANAQN